MVGRRGADSHCTRGPADARLTPRGVDRRSRPGAHHHPEAPMRANAWTVLAVTTVLPVLVGCTDHVGPEPITAGPAASIATPEGLDAALRGYLARHGFTGRVGATLEARLGRPRRPAAGRRRPAPLVRPDHRPQRRQLLRRLPLADQRLRRHAVDRHRHREQLHRRPRSPGAAQPAPHADGDQHGVLSDADVELALPRPLRRPVRQQRRLRSSRPRRGGRSRTCRTCSRRRRSSPPPSASRWRGSTSRVTTTPSAPRCCAA